MAFRPVGAKRCLGCSYRTIEYRQFRQATNSNCYQRSKLGLICSKCSRMLCIDCTTDLYSSIKTKEAHFHSDCNAYLQDLSRFVHSKGECTTEGFIGHCCMIHVHYKEEIRANNAVDTRRKRIRHTDSLLDKKSLPTAVRLGGCMALPEFELLVPSSDTCMDVLGLGKETNTLDARWHYVLDEDKADKLMTEGAQPKMMMPVTWKVHTKRVKVDLPHITTTRNAKNKTPFRVKIFYAPKVTNENPKLKGSNDISKDNVNKYFYFDTDILSLEEEKIDVTILVGFDPEQKLKTGSILLCRFHKLIPKLNKNQCPMDLLVDLKSLLKNEGLERRRTGGSSGTVSYSKALKLLMATHNSSPRCSSGVVWLRDKDNLKWHLFYINTKHGIPKHVYYTNPVPGGSFQMPPNRFETYDFLLDFVSTKPLAATIISKLKGNGVPDIQICPIAVEEELTNVRHAKAFLLKFLKDSKSQGSTDRRNAPTSFRQKIMFYQFYASNYLNFTLVQHPVGRHLDVFSDGKPSLENRVLFSYALNKHDESMLTNTGYRYGRGGCGRHRFCFALLDWTGYGRARRRVWTDERNAHLPGSANAVANEAGHGNTRLNQTIWQAFAANGNAIHLGRGVENLAQIGYNNN